MVHGSMTIINILIISERGQSLYVIKMYKDGPHTERVNVHDTLNSLFIMCKCNFRRNYLFFYDRPCAMVVPDFELICEIMLVAEGFLEARLLARKFITLYSLCKELLSKQVNPLLLLLLPK